MRKPFDRPLEALAHGGTLRGIEARAIRIILQSAGISFPIVGRRVDVARGVGVKNDAVGLGEHRRHFPGKFGLNLLKFGRLGIGVVAVGPKHPAVQRVEEAHLKTKRVLGDVDGAGQSVTRRRRGSRRAP